MDKRKKKEKSDELNFLDDLIKPNNIKTYYDIDEILKCDCGTNEFIMNNDVTKADKEEVIVNKNKKKSNKQKQKKCKKIEKLLNKKIFSYLNDFFIFFYNIFKK